MAQLIFSATVAAAVAFGLFLALFLVVRFFWLWYWRVNAVVGLLESVRDELRLLNAGQQPHPAAPAPYAPYAPYAAVPDADAAWVPGRTPYADSRT